MCFIAIVSPPHCNALQLVNERSCWWDLSFPNQHFLPENNWSGAGLLGITTVTKSHQLIFSSYGCPLPLKLACSRTFEIVCTRLGDNAILLLATNQEWWLLAKEPPGGQAAPIWAGTRVFDPTLVGARQGWSSVPWVPCVERGWLSSSQPYCHNFWLRLNPKLNPMLSRWCLLSTPHPTPSTHTGPFHLPRWCKWHRKVQAASQTLTSQDTQPPLPSSSPTRRPPFKVRFIIQSRQRFLSITRGRSALALKGEDD